MIKNDNEFSFGLMYYCKVSYNAPWCYIAIKLMNDFYLYAYIGTEKWVFGSTLSSFSGHVPVLGPTFSVPMFVCMHIIY